MLDNKSLEALAKRGLSLLRLDADKWRAVKETRFGGTRFSLTFPHETARSARRQTLALIIVQGAEACLRVGLVRSVQATATFDSRVGFDLVRQIAPNSLGALLDSVTEASLRVGVRKLAQGDETLQSVSSKLGERLIQCIADIPENRLVLQRIIAQLDRPKRFDDARALQQDAVDLALKAFGLGDGAAAVSLAGETALANVRLQEDAVIEHDARWIPGWRLDQSDLTGEAVFSRSSDRLQVFTANKRPLEELFGVDLIYLNKARCALVMVQYKMMEPNPRTRRMVTAGVFERKIVEDQEWTLSVDKQFIDELERMSRFDQDLAVDDRPYRLNSGPFYLKLVKRHASTNTSTILLSLGHLKQMIVDGATVGPRGGLRISYQSLSGHYLRNDAFVELVRSGYIGSRGATTDHLQALIDAALIGGRAVVAAIQTAITRPTGEVGIVSDFDPTIGMLP